MISHYLDKQRGGLTCGQVKFTVSVSLSATVTPKTTLLKRDLCSLREAKLSSKHRLRLDQGSGKLQEVGVLRKRFERHRLLGLDE